MTLGQRVKQILSYKEINQSSFERITGYSRASLSNIINDNTEPKIDFVKAILIYFPDINIRWLILGEGRMYITEEENKAQQVNEPMVAYKKEGIVGTLQNTIDHLLAENKRLRSQIEERGGKEE